MPGASFQTAKCTASRGEDQNLDVSPPEEWQAREAEIVRIFADFLARKLAPQSVPTSERQRLNQAF
jgi:hypothetical protein